MNRAPCRGDTRGFTLMELLVVLVIAGLLVALVPPAIGMAVPGARDRDAAREIASALVDARSAAVNRGRTETLYLWKDDPAERPVVERIVVLPATLTIRRGHPGRAATLQTIGSGTTVTFFADGSSSGAQLLVGEPGRAYRVDVDWLTGRTQVAREAPDAVL